MARPGICKNVKFKRLVKTLDLPRPYVLGLLEVLWSVAYESGRPIIGNSEDIEIAAEWPGNPGEFFGAMRDGRWIDSVDGADDLWEIHDLLENAPDYVRKRASRDRSQKTKGLANSGSEGESGKTKDLCTVSSADVRHPADSGRQRRPSPPLPSQPIPKKKNEDEASSCSEPSGADAHEPPDPEVLSFLLVGKGTGDGNWWPLKASKLKEYEESYPDLDILGQLRAARQWLADNPGKRKTARGMTRFLNSWLARVQNAGAGKNPAGKPADPITEFLDAERAKDKI